MMKMRNIFKSKKSSTIQDAAATSLVSSEIIYPEYTAFREQYLVKAKNKEELADAVLFGLARELELVQGVFLQYAPRKARLSFLAGYACTINDKDSYNFELGEGFPGQVAADRETLYLNDLPENYLRIRTGLGEALPRTLVVAPVKKNRTLIGVVELASFKAMDEKSKEFIEDVLSHFATEPASFKSPAKK